MIALARRRHLRRLLAARTTPSDRAARVALPAPPAGVGSQGDAPSPYRRRVMLDIAQRPPVETVHNGSDDLLVWPPSTVEVELATRWLVSGHPAVRDDLYRVCQSEDRAAAIAEKVHIDRRAVAADRLLARAFGVAP